MTTPAEPKTPESVAEAKKRVGQIFFTKAISPIAHSAASLVEKLGTKGIAILATVLIGGGAVTSEAAGITEITPLHEVAANVSGATADDRIHELEGKVDVLGASIALLGERIDNPVVSTGQTLRFTLMPGQRYLPLVIGSYDPARPVHVGGNGVTEGIKISGPIECESLLIDGLHAPSLEMSSSTVYSLTVKDNVVDGVSLNFTVDNTVPNVIMSSLRGASTLPTVENSTYDRIIIEATATTTIKSISLLNVKTFGAPSKITGLVCGDVTVKNSRIGDGDGISSPDLVIASTFKANHVLNASNNLEVTTNVR